MRHNVDPLHSDTFHLRTEAICAWHETAHKRIAYSTLNSTVFFLASIIEAISGSLREIARNNLKESIEAMDAL